jgi:hypothetical protein
MTPRNISYSVLTVLLVVMVFVTLDGISIRNEGINRELTLTAEYKKQQAVLSNFQAGIESQFAVVKNKQEALQILIVTTVNGGYSKQGSLVLALGQAFPELRGLDIFNQLLQAIQVGYDKFGNEQANMQDMVRQYNSFRQTGVIRPALASFFRFPSEVLVAQIGNDVVTGPKALDRMSSLVQTDASKNSFKSGTLEPVIAVPSPKG